MSRRLGRKGKIWYVTCELGIRFLLRSIQVRRNLFSVLFVVIRENISIRHAQYFQTIDPRHLLLIEKVGIAELLEPIEVVENGMIHAVRTTRSDVRRRHAEMLQEHRVIGATAQITDGHVSARLHCRSTTSVSNRFLWCDHLFRD